MAVFSLMTSRSAMPRLELPSTTSASTSTLAGRQTLSADGLGPEEH